MAQPTVAVVGIPDGDTINGDEGIMPLESRPWQLDSKWTRVVSGNMGGRNIAIQVQDFNSALYQVDIMYENAAGREIKTEWNITGVFSDKTVTCPSGTFFVKYRIAPRFGWVTGEKIFNATITW